MNKILAHQYNMYNIPCIAYWLLAATKILYI